LVLRSLREPRHPARGGPGADRHVPGAAAARAGADQANHRPGSCRRLRHDVARAPSPDPRAPRLQPADPVARREARRQHRDAGHRGGRDQGRDGADPRAATPRGPCVPSRPPGPRRAPPGGARGRDQRRARAGPRGDGRRLPARPGARRRGGHRRHLGRRQGLEPSCRGGTSARFHSPEGLTRLARASKAGAVCDKGRRRFEDLDEAAARVPASRGCPTSIRGAARLGTARTRLSTAVGDSNRDKGEYQRMRRITLVAVIAATALAGLAAGAANSAAVKTTKDKPKASIERAVFFAADGMRQDIVERYAKQGLMPTMSEFLKKGTSAKGNGLLTQAPPNTGAGWYSLATGAWPGVYGSTNNTFHINGQPFGNRTAAFDPNVLQAESIAQSAERGGLKVAQVEWAGGRNATIQGPTIDFQSFFSGRGVATNFIGQSGDV